MRSAMATLGLVLSLASVRAGGQTVQDPPAGRPDGVIDLASHEGVHLVNGQWRYHDVKIEDADKLVPYGDTGSARYRQKHHLVKKEADYHLPGYMIGDSEIILTIKDYISES